jgi:hypothetical protein
MKYLSGEHGPVFVGFGDVPKLSFWQRWRGTVGIAFALAVGSLFFMLVL